MSNSARNNEPLNGVKVLDLSRVLAGPFATQMLADLGAEVIKIEHPERGDDTRQWGPPFVQAADGTRGNAAYFYCANRNKNFVGIDFKTPEGQKRIKQLAADADVLVENYKVDGLKAYGLDYASLKTINPRLVYCSITGFGQTGPYRYRPGYDFIIQGMSGLMSVTGKADGEPGGEPLRTGVAMADLSSGLHAVSGICAALYARNQSNRGCHIDISLLDVQVSLLSHHATNYLNSGDVPSRIGNTHPNIVPYQVFSTSDHPIIIAVGNDSQFARLCETLEQSAWSESVRFERNHQRVENREELVSLIQSVLTSQPASHWLEKLHAVNVPAGPVNNLEQVFNDPQVIARNLQLRTDTEDTKGVGTVASPIVIKE
ncbi:MAG: CaiB/BaiF CoA transferase family protein [Gammaproteobacteria bacterium]